MSSFLGLVEPSDQKRASDFILHVLRFFGSKLYQKKESKSKSQNPWIYTVRATRLHKDIGISHLLPENLAEPVLSARSSPNLNPMGSTLT